MVSRPSHISEANQAIGCRLAQFRSCKGLSQTDLAQQAGGTKRGLQDNEKGETLPNSKMLIGLHHLGLNINWLLTGNGDMLLSASEMLPTPLPAPAPTPDKSADQQIELTAAMVMVENMLAQLSCTLKPQQRASLTMLIFEAMQEGKNGDKLKNFATRLGELL